jgi:hypothetical protein
MKRLKEIGMKKNWIYEVIVSTFCVRGPHAAPMGIWSEDLDTLNMAIYKDSKTLENIIKEGEFIVNFVDDIKIFYGSLFNKGKIAFKQARQINAPVIKDSSAIIECKVKHIEKMENRFHISAEIAGIRIWDEIKLINRAEGLAIESLILATRLPHFTGRRNEDALKENFRIIGKVAPGSTYEHIMEKVMDLFKLLD